MGVPKRVRFGSGEPPLNSACLRAGSYRSLAAVQGLGLLHVAPSVAAGGDGRL